MPELPEVQTVVDHLALNVLGQVIQKVQVIWPSIVHHDPTFSSKLVGQHIQAMSRRGKYILFHLDVGYLVVHLRMEGKFFLQKEQDPIAKHTHVTLLLDLVRLDYHDTRKFGRFEFVENLQDYFKDRLGLEPFDQALTPKHLKHLAKTRSIPLKAFLLDQKMMAGIGNIYADESCFEAMLSPFKPVNKLKETEWERLIIAIRKVLSLALESGGSTIRSYTVSHGVSGRFQQSLKVYGRAHLPCTRCGQNLDKGIVNQRSTVYCGVCQKVSQDAHRHYGIHGQRKI